jgi:hypothetical protein
VLSIILWGIPRSLCERWFGRADIQAPCKPPTESAETISPFILFAISTASVDFPVAVDPDDYRKLRSNGFISDKKACPCSRRVTLTTLGLPCGNAFPEFVHLRQKHTDFGFRQRLVFP